MKTNALTKSGTNVVRRGYTLMEILAAASIVAIMASVALPAMNGFFVSQRLRAEAENFIQNVRAAQYRAMESSTYHRLYFLPDGSGYQISEYKSGPGVVAAPTAEIAGDPGSSDWEDGDVGTFEIDPAITFTPPTGLSAIFFSPDGTLTSTPEFNANPIPDCIATFSYNDNVLTVNITPIGIRASEEFYEE